ncbi:phosphotransferase [Bacillus pseudomycoides]|nr:phosphotransferase [Bacillus pseudomycoides]
MASGKSTVAELMAKKFEKSVHLRGDIFRKMIVSGRKEMSGNSSEEAENQLDLRYQLTAEVAKGYSNAGFTVIVQDNYYGEKLPYILELMAPEKVESIVLIPNANVIRERERNRGKAGYIGFNVDGLREEFLKTTPHIGLWIDNSVEQPHETVDHIMNELGMKSN